MTPTIATITAGGIRTMAGSPTAALGGVVATTTVKRGSANAV